MRLNKPKVSILMGSDSDLGIMKSAAEILDQFRIAYELKIISAHRSPQQTMHYTQKAEKRGIEVIIAGAGGAAHLPGVVAAWCTLPVIGVPIKTKNFQGIDSFISMVEMPRGVPVATVGIDNATNAALFAVAILAGNNPAIRKKLIMYRKELNNKIIAANSRLLAKVF